MPELTPPGMKPENHTLTPPDAGRKRKKRKKPPALLIGLFVLFLIVDAVVLVYWLLPTGKRKPPPAPETVQQEAVEVPGRQQPAGASVREKARLAAEAALNDWLHLQAGAEAENIAGWGGEAYGDITALVDQGDAAFAKQDFARAGKLYIQAGKRLQALLASKPELLSAALDNGRAALEAEDSKTAIRYFTRALELEADNQEAAHGRQRAENLDQVLSLHRQGLELEKKGRLDEARSTLSKAVRLDPEFQPAAAALARVEEKLRQRKFRQAMSGFFAAMDKNDLGQARRSLQEAAAINPADPVVKDAAKQLKNAEITARLAALERAFNRFAAAEQWEKARQACEQALRLDPRAGFAVQSLEMVKQRIALEQAIRKILQKPGRLQDDGPLAEAGQVLETARAVNNPGPKLTALTASLDRLLDRASTDVEVTLRSDNATEVIIYRVGKLGKFVRKQLKLRPGVYTVVGSRPGFRDVRRTLEVKADRNISLSIRCEEQI